MSSPPRRPVDTLLSLLDRRPGRDTGGSPLLASMAEDISAIRADLEALRRVDRETWISDMLDAYATRVNESGLQASTKATYLRGASQFVRWMRSEFDPGARKPGDD